MSSAWDPDSPVQQHLGPLFATLRPPLPSMRQLVKLREPRRALELGVADGKMLMAAMAILQEQAGPRATVCGAGINSLRYYYGTHDVVEEIRRKKKKGTLSGGSGADRVCAASPAVRVCRTIVYRIIGPHRHPCRWLGVPERRDWDWVAKYYGLPRPLVTPQLVHCDVFQAGIPVRSRDVDLLISQATVDKWRDYPKSFVSHCGGHARAAGGCTAAQQNQRMSRNCSTPKASGTKQHVASNSQQHAASYIRNISRVEMAMHSTAREIARVLSVRLLPGPALHTNHTHAFTSCWEG